MPHRTLNLTLASSLALTAAAALLATPAALAANFTWDGNGSTAPNPNGGTGTWDLANSNWWDGASNVVWTDTSGTADTATFANTAGTVTLDTSLGALGLNFTTTGYTISGTGTISLGASGIDASTLASGTTAINTNLALVASQTWNVGTGALITSTGVISGSGFGITKTGAGSLTLSGTNTFDGGLTVKSGTVTLNNNTAAGSGAITLGDTSGSANATVGAVFTGTIANAINVVAGSTGVLTIDNRSGNGAVVTFTGAITLANDVTLAKSTGDRNSVTSGDITGTGNITIKNATVDQTLTLGKIGGSYNAIGSITNLSTATGGATVAILSDIGGNVVNITQNGVTKMILSGTNTNTGLVSIQAGVLDFQKAVSLYNNTPGSWTAANIDVKSGATLGLGLGGPGAFASADIDTIRTNLDTATPGQGFESGASLGIDTTGNNATYASTIANPNGGANVLGFVKLGGNTLTLSGPNTYTGPTQITGGALSVASLNSVSGGTASSNLGAPTTVANGTINFFGSSFGNGQLTYTGAGETTDRVLNLSGGGQYTATLDQSGTGLLKFTSDMTFAGASGSKILILQGNTAGTGEFAGAIGNKDANNLTVVRKAGTGTWTLSGANTYTGTTSVNGGILSVASLNSVSGGSASSNLGAPKTVPNGTIAVGSGVTAATLLYTGAGETTDRVINLAGTTGGATIDQSGTGLLKFTSAFTATGGGNKTLTLQGFAAGTGEIAGAIVDNTAVTKITSLTKAGTGTWTLSGANSYTGATNVNEGKLLVNGSLASGSAVTVASTATLGGSGTIGGAVTVQAGGKLAPGTSPGQLTVGSLTLAVDSTTQMEIGGATLGTGYDNVTVTTAGGLTYGGLLDIVSYGIYNVAAQSGSYELFTFTGGYAGDFGTVTVNGFALANTAGVWSGTNGGITYTFTDSTGVLQVVPEPAALALLCLGAVGLLRRRRAG